MTAITAYRPSLVVARERGPRGLAPDHEWVSPYQLRFRNPDGSWGSTINLQGPAGPSGGSQIFETQASANSATIDVAIREITVLGYSAFGDCQPSTWIRVASEPTHPAKLRSTDRFLPSGTTDTGDGGWWECSSDPIPAGAVGAIDGLSHSDMYDAHTRCRDAMLALKRFVDFPAGDFGVGDTNLPYRQALAAEAITELLDFQGVGIIASGGNQTIFSTTSSDGADVFQLNAVKGFRILGFPTITATLTAFDDAGSNGVSITNGYDDLHIEVNCVDLPSVPKVGDNYVDGGKALTVQPADTTMKCGSLTAIVRAKGCAYGFGSDLILDTVANNGMHFDVQFLAEDCYIAATIAGLALTSDVPVQMGFNIRGTAINCQRGFDLNRVHGGAYDLQVITTKSYTERRLDPNGERWLSSDDMVEAFRIVYAKNSSISVAGHMQECNFVGRLGGTYSGGPVGDTSDCDFYFDVGSAPINDWIQLQDFGGNSVRNCRIYATSRTLPSGIDALLYTPALGNQITIGPTARFVNPLVSGRLDFAGGADGKTVTGKMIQTGNVTGLQGLNSATDAVGVTGLFDAAGVAKFVVRNGAGQGWETDAFITTSPVGSYAGMVGIKIAGVQYGFPAYTVS